MKKVKQLIAVAIIFSMVVGSVGVLKTFDTKEEGKLVGFGTFNSLNHDPDPSKS